MIAATPTPTPTPATSQPASAQSSGFDTTPVIGWTLTHILPLLLLVIGISIIAKSRRGNLRDAATTTGQILIGVFVVIGAAAFIAFGEKVAGLVTGQ